MTRPDRYQFDPRTLLATFGDTDPDMIAEILGVRRDQIYRWFQGDTMWDCWRADLMAIRAGTHPIYVWGNQWFDAIPDEEEQRCRRIENKKRYRDKLRARNA